MIGFKPFEQGWISLTQPIWEPPKRISVQPCSKGFFIFNQIPKIMSKYQQYEAAKQRLRDKNLSPAEYEKQIKKLIEAYQI